MNDIKINDYYFKKNHRKARNGILVKITDVTSDYVDYRYLDDTSGINFTLPYDAFKCRFQYDSGFYNTPLYKVINNDF